MGFVGLGVDAGTAAGDFVGVTAELASAVLTLKISRADRADVGANAIILCAAKAVVGVGVDALVVAGNLSSGTLQLAGPFHAGFTAIALGCAVTAEISTAKDVVSFGVDTVAFAFNQTLVTLNFAFSFGADRAGWADFSVLLVARAAVFGAAKAVVGQRVDALPVTTKGSRRTLGLAAAVGADLIGTAGLTGIATGTVEGSPTKAKVGLGVDAFAVALDLVGPAVLRAFARVANLAGLAGGSGMLAATVQ